MVDGVADGLNTVSSVQWSSVFGGRSFEDDSDKGPQNRNL